MKCWRRERGDRNSIFEMINIEASMTRQRKYRDEEKPWKYERQAWSQCGDHLKCICDNNLMVTMKNRKEIKIYLSWSVVLLEAGEFGAHEIKAMSYVTMTQKLA